MKKLQIIVVLLMAAGCSINTFGQGCVAIRSTGGFCTRDVATGKDGSDKWLLNLNNRYFKSYKHFVGTEEQKQRVEQGTEVINYAYTLDINLTRNFIKGWSVAIDVPIVSNARSSLYEHGGNNAGKGARHSTHSFGLGDIRIAAYKWLVNPALMSKWNVQVGLGLKFATGDYKYQDYFIKNDSTKVLGPVDQSIQLGDGGTGFTTEVNAFYNFNHHVGVYGNFYYLFNPREQNGVSTARGGTPSASSILYGSDVMSVPDQLMVRAGASVLFGHFNLSAGVRDECLPVRDLIGGDNGFRRPGYIVSFEPGATYQFKNVTLYAYVPVALKRDRTQSVPDKIRTRITGTYAQGDAAFADYLVNAGLSIKF